MKNDEKAGPKVRHWLAGSFLLAGLLLCVATFFHGKTGFEKTAIRLVTPLGAGWVILGASTWACLWSKRRSASVCWGSAWALLTICTCDPIVSLSTQLLESSVPHPELSQESPLDYVAVLGGGTSLAPGRAQLDESGDRVMLGAQLYKLGYTKKLITTGEAISSIGGEHRIGPAEQTLEIWTKLGIPEDDILTLPGINTYLETKALAAEIRDGELRGKRVGLLTSAFHLPRAIRLARSHGIEELTPIAADFRAKTNPYYTVMDFLPSTKALNQLYKNQHEFMAKLVGR